MSTTYFYHRQPRESEEAFTAFRTYLDPLNDVQIELLKRHRAGDTDERVVQAIHLTINGIAAGLRNSG